MKHVGRFERESDIGDGGWKIYYLGGLRSSYLGGGAAIELTRILRSEVARQAASASLN